MSEALQDLDISVIEEMADNLAISIKRYTNHEISAGISVQELLDELEQIRIRENYAIDDENMIVEVQGGDDDAYINIHYYKRKTRTELINDITYLQEADKRQREQELATYRRLKEKFEGQ
jgi:hypothetical protein